MAVAKGPAPFEAKNCTSLAAIMPGWLVLLLACQVAVAVAGGTAAAPARPHTGALLDAPSSVLQPIPGAKGKCLDGSPPVIYTGPATNESDRHKWVLYFHGGGWCFSAAQ